MVWTCGKCGRQFDDHVEYYEMVGICWLCPECSEKHRVEDGDNAK